LTSLEGVPSAYAAARDGIDVMLRDRGLRRTSPETTAGVAAARRPRERRARRAPVVDLAECREGAGDEVAGARPGLAELLALRPALDRSPLQALARIHAWRRPGSRPTTGSAGRGTPRRRPAARRRPSC
jgi:hypothetical protein